MPAVALADAPDHGGRSWASTTPDGRRHRRGSGSFVDVLEREWRALAMTGDWATTVRRWGWRHPAVLAGCRTPDDVLDAIRRDPDPVLLALLELAGGDDMTAGRVIVQSMLPKLIVMARRDPDHETADYVSWLWVVIRRYPTGRRRHRVAANLSLDTLKQATRSRVRREIPYRSESLAQLGHEASRTATDETGTDALTATRVINGARRLGLVDDATARVLTLVYDTGLPGREAAELLDMSVDTVRWRCSRAVRTLAAHSHELLEAA